jgi:hypothetical protein
MNFMMLTVTGVPEFDVFFSLVFTFGFIGFVVSIPLRLFMNRTM